MLALWEYFWDTADWVGAPAPAPPPSQADVARGSGHKHKYVEPEYLRAGDDFWEVREAYIRAKVPLEVREEIKSPNPEPEEVKPIVELRDKAYHAAYNAENLIDLQNLIGQVLELTGTIISLRAQYDDEAITLLLLS